MSSSVKKTPSEALEVGDTFNETDDDVLFEVTSIRKESNPPVVLCVPIDGEATEEEYDVDYVQNAVMARKKYVSEGYSKYGAREIYKMCMKELKNALVLAKQNVGGSKSVLRDKMMIHNNVTEVPSDVSTCGDEDESSPRKKKNKRNQRVPRRRQPPHQQLCRTTATAIPTCQI